jgi:hypothetical protein
MLTSSGLSPSVPQPDRATGAPGQAGPGMWLAWSIAVWPACGRWVWSSGSWLAWRIHRVRRRAQPGIWRISRPTLAKPSRQDALANPSAGSGVRVGASWASDGRVWSQ